MVPFFSPGFPAFFPPFPPSPSPPFLHDQCHYFFPRGAAFLIGNPATFSRLTLVPFTPGPPFFFLPPSPSLRTYFFCCLLVDLSFKTFCPAIPSRYFILPRQTTRTNHFYLSWGTVYQAFVQLFTACPLRLPLIFSIAVFPTLPFFILRSVLRSLRFFFSFFFFPPEAWDF